MKNIHLSFLVLFALLVSCRNDDNSPENPVDSLPPATQVGAQTFGCLIDGEVFLPKDFGHNRLHAFYQNIEGLYYLGISTDSKDGVSAISIQGEELSVLDENIYSLGSEKKGGINGLLIKGSTNDLIVRTTDSKPGILKITHHDTQNGILSGTFEFTVLDNNGKEIKVTDGRFDVNYTN